MSRHLHYLVHLGYILTAAASTQTPIGPGLDTFPISGGGALGELVVFTCGR